MDLPENYRETVELVENAQPWAENAACKNHPEPDLWHPAQGDTEYSARVKLAKLICKACEVKQECLDYALEIGEKGGVYGGLTYRQRKNL